MSGAAPARGEIWQVDLAPTRGHEQSGLRPALVISVDEFNYGPAGLVVVLPVTRRDRGIALHVRIEPPEGGVEQASVIWCDQIRCVSQERLRRCLGRVSAATLREVEDRLRILLGL